MNWKRAAYHGRERMCVTRRERGATGTVSLQRHLDKAQTKIQNVMPNKATGSAENIGYSVFLSFGGCPPGHPPTITTGPFSGLQSIIIYLYLDPR